MVHYLKEEYSVPVVVVVERKSEENSRSQKVVDWVDCALTINSDVDVLFEAVSELIVLVELKISKKQTTCSTLILIGKANVFF